MSNTELKKIKGRVQNKHKTEAEWYLDVYKAADSTELRNDPFIPLDGELIIYDPDSVHTGRRIKIGDGVTNVVALSFYEEGIATAVNIMASNTTTLQAVVNALLENNKNIYAPNLISVNSGKALVVAFSGETGGMYTISDLRSGRTFQSGNNYANVILYDLIDSTLSYYDTQGNEISTAYDTIESAVSNLLKDVGDVSTALDSIIAQTDSIIGGNS